MSYDWDEAVAAVWADETLTELEVIERIDALAAQRGPADARAMFERAGARDSAGLETEAEPLYRRALELGLDDEHRPQAVIQLASTIRNLGRSEEAVRMLREEYDAHPDSPYRSATAAFLALALTSRGESVEAVSLLLTTLVPHLPRYHRSVTGYAAELLTGRG